MLSAKTQDVYKKPHPSIKNNLPTTEEENKKDPSYGQQGTPHTL